MKKFIKMFKLFRVAKKETLTVFTTNGGDPYKLAVGTYNVILYESEPSKFRVRVFGALASLQDYRARKATLLKSSSKKR